MRPLNNSSTVYNNNKMHLFYQKTRQIASYFPHFLIKYALFSYYSKPHLNYSKVSKLHVPKPDLKMIYMRGFLLPINLCQNDDKKDFFIELQRFIKKIRKNSNFYLQLNNHLKNNGFGFLKAHYSTARHSFVTFEVHPKIFSQLLTDFHLVSQINDDKGSIFRVKESIRFKTKTYPDFLKQVYNKWQLLKWTIYPFRLYYVFEHIRKPSDDDIERFAPLPLHMPATSLQRYFKPKADLWIESLFNIKWVVESYGWIDMHIRTTNYNFMISCSDYMDPFIDIYNWLQLIKIDNRNHSFEIDEEGRVKTFEAYPFADKVYIIIHEEHDGESVYLQGVFERKKFVNKFIKELEQLVLVQIPALKEFVWRGKKIFQLQKLLKQSHNKKNTL
ncbi:MAG: hypothetical protein DRQ51_06715 [Gammaproteobacteria bacterium]|nr:MAG: hypothetical protein DRQ51_06715 [Gammaproteobacteria bacterium]